MWKMIKKIEINAKYIEEDKVIHIKYMEKDNENLMMIDSLSAQ